MKTNSKSKTVNFLNANRDSLKVKSSLARYMTGAISTISYSDVDNVLNSIERLDFIHSAHKASVSMSTNKDSDIVVIIKIVNTDDANWYSKHSIILTSV